ncbi:YhbY family RNA-binding protein [Paraclostridium bifermentans]|jgi:RNA-binding protein|uniref:CRS1 / YhbY domain protein n=1 Tax=Paraclostridium bifermentans ATCC 638 = DSM 14991 TaxID=1233171 RepID=T4VK46_PARBF|nr:YhbY family RNA-binding protein [Paraclostridium bifermentans]RDC51002.1 RNA-binding protein [Acinetobacter sp. RIT592]EQK41853.1 CRS1 / YhbY domain protein [[Clostridium] bifermentans ATCC 638] [Paraclostridium bifermentans ATCC 638 = DSM 14991]MBS5953322.1 YhbY family RNA-binding protein [Paraclostridium bifermentans]MBS6506619.1 YhbY family RNA-binding protein [Paraclostridium bifermentans]MBU5288486.1 YhbY family RNA-binding protein [Paraclostridium bifermentans]
MLKGKQRAYLRSVANTLKPITQIGKEGVTESFLDQLEDMLKAREIVKVSILENAGLDAKETANAICEAIRAEFVQAIGFKFTIYKKNEEDPKIIFPGHEQAKAKKVDNTVSKKGRPTKKSRR